jgi:hypothetical protein
MGETSTKNELTNPNEVMNLNVTENLEADDLLFYHSIRVELDLLKKSPKLQTIHAILDHSKSLR